jgi:hypothetical protein
MDKRYGEYTPKKGQTKKGIKNQTLNLSIIGGV